MRALPVLFALAIALAVQVAPARAQGLADSDRAAIAAVIESQLEAFRSDDGAKAFSYASPGIRSMFQTPEFFMDMVRNGYAPVYRPQSHAFRDLDLSGSLPVQDVYLVGPDGTPVIARYTMERQPDGSWRIAGCQLIDAGLSV
ncbi:MAG: DUF4864 domain-containing protein [Alphaproteobacteria bacterium]